MSSAARFDINSLDVHYSNFVSRDDASLIEIKPMLGFCLLLGLEVLLDGVTFQDDPVGFVLDLHLHLFGNGSIMGDVEVGVMLCFFGS